MDNVQVHYLSYDPEEIWLEIVTAFVEAGGDVLYPGDEKEILLRGVQATLVQVFAGVDNALRMDTLRYAVGDYLDIYGEKRNCIRIEAAKAESTVEIKFRATGQAKILPEGTAMTADGAHFYTLAEAVEQTGYAQTVQARVVCTQPGGAGNGLLAGMQMQLAITNPAIESVFVKTDAAGGKEREDDETYRERIRQFGLINITTGPEIQYEAVAKNVTSEILDAQAIHKGEGKVGVYLILQRSEGAAAILESVRQALNAQHVRPLTDEVEVYEAQAVPYTLNVQYKVGTDSNTSTTISQALAEYQAWQDNSIGRAFNPDKLMASLYQAGATRVVWGEGSNFNGNAVEYTEIDPNKRCKGTITLAVMSP